MMERRGVCRVSVGKPEGKRPLGGHRHKREDSSLMDLNEVGRGWAWSGFIWLRIGTGGGQL